MSKENKTKKIFRVEKDKNYSVIHNPIFLDKRISWGAKGVLGYALTKPDDWDLYISEVTKNGTDKIDKVTKYFKELRLSGYIEYVITRERGKITKTEYLVYEKPLHQNPINMITRHQIRKEKKLKLEKSNLDSPRQEKPQMEKPFVENTSLVNTDYLLNTDINQILKESLSSFQTKLISEKLTSSKFIEYKNRLRSIDEKFNLSYLESSKANQYYEQAQKKYEELNSNKSFSEFFESILAKLEKLTSQKLDRFAFKQGFTIESLVKFDLQGCAKVEAWYNDCYPSGYSSQNSQYQGYDKEQLKKEGWIV